MRKSDNSRKPAGGKSFKPKDGGGSFKRASGTRSKEGAKPYGDRKERSGDESPRPRRSSGDSTGRKPYRADSDRPYKKEFSGDRDKSRRSEGGDDRKPFNKRSGDDKSDVKPRRKFEGFDEKKSGPADYGKDQYSRDKGSSRGSSDRSDRKPFKRSSGDDKPDFKPRRKFEDSDEKKSFGRGDREEKRSFRKNDGDDKPSFRKSAGDDKKPFRRGGDSNARKYASPSKFEGKSDKRSFSKKEDASADLKRVKFDDFEDGKVFSNLSSDRAGKKPRKTFKKQGASARIQTATDGMIRLNKYLSNSGIASRREADSLIQSGVVKVNGVVVDQLGAKINPSDKVTYGDAAVRNERKVYLLLNKPKDYITTTDDPQERKTVMELIAKACKERVYPVGRLDRNTTGLLLFTNDGALTTKLMHPKFGVKKIYHVSLNKGLKPDDFTAISEGIELEDGFVKADDVAFVGEGKKEIGIEIHSGRNRIVRRIFEHLGYDVLKLDRVAFAGLTKKDLPRGKHRFLTAKEIGFLQMIG
jgi:23S rRNA pseudouridine2605 synthase